MSRLREMFDKQEDLIEHVIQEHGPFSNSVTDTVTAIVGELGEILEADQSWKHWRKNPPKVDSAHVQGELGDLWHFVVQLTLFLGYSDEDIYNAYMRKNKINHERQDNDY